MGLDQRLDVFGSVVVVMLWSCNFGYFSNLKANNRCWQNKVLLLLESMEETKNGGRKPFRILSISGGGTRGIIPSLILLRLEQITGCLIGDLFDLFIGTSTGAMICAVLTIPKFEPVDGKEANASSAVVPKYTSKDLLDVYLKEGPMVFESSRWRRVTTINGVYGPMYYTKNRDERFNVWMGDTRLKDLMGDVLFTSYDLCTKSPIFFKSRKARSEAESDYLLSDCIKAATAAPTVWSPHLIRLEDDTSEKKELLREGLYMDALHGKNPSMFALVEAIKHYGVSAEDVVLLSLGTGHSRKHEDPKKIVITGPAFLMEAFNNTINANTMSTMYMVRALIRNPSQVLDLDPPLSEEHMGITDVSREHIDYMIKVTQEYMAQHEEEIVAFAKLLMPESQWKPQIPEKPEVN
jgi:patatin-like phospholipase/acyl hydrolase